MLFVTKHSVCKNFNTIINKVFLFNFPNGNKMILYNIGIDIYIFIYTYIFYVESRKKTFIKCDVNEHETTFKC